MYRHAISLIESGRPHEAEAELRKLLTVRPDDPALHVNLGLARESMGDLPGAAAIYHRVLRRDPEHKEAQMNLAGLLARTAQLVEAEALCVRLVERAQSDRDRAWALRTLALTRIEQLRLDEALACLRAAAETLDTPAAWSEFLAFSVHAGYDAGAHRQWVERFAPAPTEVRAAAPWDGKRPLRIGFIGDVFRHHAVASMLLPIIEHTRHACVIFSDVPPPLADPLTARFKRLSAQWHDTAPGSDRALLPILTAANLDVLVDLQGHKPRSRLMALADLRLRGWPTPMVGYIGYPGDTILARGIDAEVGWAYVPGANVPPVSPAPCVKNGYVTFGSIHRAAKISARTMELWAGVLKSWENSRLIVAVLGGEKNTVARQRLIAAGVPNERLNLIGRVRTHEEYLARAELLDVHLDAAPYGGGATTLEMAWQGVPTLRFDESNGLDPIGARLSQALGLGELIPRPDVLSQIRSELRERMQRGDLLDGESVARRFDEAVEKLVPHGETTQPRGPSRRQRVALEEMWAHARTMLDPYPIGRFSGRGTVIWCHDDSFEQACISAATVRSHDAEEPIEIFCAPVWPWMREAAELMKVRLVDAAELAAGSPALLDDSAQLRAFTALKCSFEKFYLLGPGQTFVAGPIPDPSAVAPFIDKRKDWPAIQETHWRCQHRLMPQPAPAPAVAPGTLPASVAAARAKHLVFCRLQSNGDLLTILPALKWRALQGHVITLVTYERYLPLIEGIPWLHPIGVDSMGGLRHPEAMDRFRSAGTIVNVSCDQTRLDRQEWQSNWQHLAWHQTGTPLELFDKLPLELENRNFRVEDAIVERYRHRPELPLVLIGLAGESSPFDGGDPLRTALMARFADAIEIIDVSLIRCRRITDLSGLFDIAIGGVFTDSGPWHLAKAFELPMVGLTRDKEGEDCWRASAPRVHHILRLSYGQAATKEGRQAICQALENLLFTRR